MRKIKAEDFTEDELFLLKLTFSLATNVVEMEREGNYDVNMCNSLYSLKEKLSVCDLVK